MGIIETEKFLQHFFCKFLIILNINDFYVLMSVHNKFTEFPVCTKQLSLDLIIIIMVLSVCHPVLLSMECSSQKYTCDVLCMGISLLRACCHQGSCPVLQPAWGDTGLQTTHIPVSCILISFQSVQRRHSHTSFHGQGL